LQPVASQTVPTAQRVNEQSFADLLVPLLQSGYRLAGAMLHDPQAAEDVVQEASLIAWRKLPRLEDRRNVRAWFLGIVANECRNARRRRWLSSVTLGLPSRLAVGSGEDRIVSRADLRQALRQLRYEDQLVVTLYFYLDMPMPEIAGVAGISIEAARSRLYRAVRHLRPELATEEALR
jgi:RNA polymerase sigma-70 factor (ECF subfamily)